MIKLTLFVLILFIIFNFTYFQSYEHFSDDTYYYLTKYIMPWWHQRYRELPYPRHDPKDFYNFYPWIRYPYHISGVSADRISR